MVLCDVEHPVIAAAMMNNAMHEVIIRLFICLVFIKRNEQFLEYQINITFPTQKVPVLARIPSLVVKQ